MHVVPRIHAARWADKDLVAALIADALHAGPLAQWLVPDPTYRRRILTDVAVIWVEHAMFFGDIQITDDLSAAAMGFHRYRSIPPPPNYRSRLADAAGPHARQFELLDHILTQVRPTEPHYHLAVLAIPPAAQRRGVGAAMLTHHESRLDRIDMPSWTETIHGGQDVYRRYGYLPRPALTLPDGPVLAPMRRNPHPKRGSWPVNTAKPATVTAPARAQSDAQR
ncbi:N-acetyltransferase [Micromonospora chalcea]|uniref:GNAT family N-acetyltransferase n=1 Tax=Micromonospora chalcea TaxID=1874 RepID=UPI0021A817EA|nr:GNAT family N-acetyltransferase [Micromonospora chalcea]MCT2276989.1 N-acetyltransferase [Micromonospora chalcea]